MATLRHIVVARTDKIGDLLLSLPAIQALKKSFPGVRVTALVSSYAMEIVQSHPAIDIVEPLEPGEGLFALAGRLRKLEADAFLALYPRPLQALAAWLAGIPLRVGTAYRWYSFFFNRRIKVHRSASERHEVEYNLDLVKALGGESPAGKIEFPLAQAERDSARNLLEERGIVPGTPYVVVHPGHRGSALNWKPEKYGELAAHLCRKKGLRVVLTAGEQESDLIQKATAHLGSLPPVQQPVPLVGTCTLRQLAAVYEGAVCFVSGSTGTMHLAAAVGTPTVSLFCPIPETTPVRWGPWGNESTVLMPKDLECPNCQAGSCRQHDPMDAIPVAEVLKAVEKYIGKNTKLKYLKAVDSRLSTVDRFSCSCFCCRSCRDAPFCSLPRAERITARVPAQKPPKPPPWPSR